MRPLVAIEISVSHVYLIEQFGDRSEASACEVMFASVRKHGVALSPLLASEISFRLLWMPWISRLAPVRLVGTLRSDGSIPFCLSTCFETHSPIACPLHQMPHVPRWLPVAESPAIEWGGL